jgi:hypothetical protein
MHAPFAYLTDFSDADRCADRVFAPLAAAARAPGHPFRAFAVATADPAGAPEVRTVILRGFDPLARTLTFFTDSRSPKFDYLVRQKRAALLFYDPTDRLQVRTLAAVTVRHGDAEARLVWSATRGESRTMYAERYAPGEEVPPETETAHPSVPPVDDPFAFGNFAVVECRFDSLDVLELSPVGNRRAVLTWDGDAVRLTRLAP